MTIYDLTVKTNSGESRSLSEYRGEVLLIVNTASQCGFTPQYRGLEELFRRFHPEKFEVLGFPCDQFGHQEPGSDAEIRSFCELNFNITFPLFAKIEVNGPGADPLYNFLKGEKGGLFTSAIKWNFTKFLISRRGKVIGRYSPSTKPEQLAAEIERELRQEQ